MLMLYALIITLCYTRAGPVFSGIDNRDDKTIEWSHLIHKRFSKNENEFGTRPLQRENNANIENPTRPKQANVNKPTINQPTTVNEDLSFDWRLLQNANDDLPEEMNRRRKRSLSVKTGRAKRSGPGGSSRPHYPIKNKIIRTKRDMALQSSSDDDPEGRLMEQWGAERNLAMDNDGNEETPTTIQLTENDLKKLARLIEEMEDLNSGDSEGSPRMTDNVLHDFSPNEDNEELALDDEDDDDYEHGHETLRPLVAGYQGVSKDRQEKLDRNNQYHPLVHRFRDRYLKKRSSYDDSPPSYYQYKIREEPDDVSDKNDLIWVKLPNSYNDDISNNENFDDNQYFTPPTRRNLILIDPYQILSAGDSVGPMPEKNHRLMSEMELEKKIISLARLLKVKRESKRRR